nr:CBS domain-containing protein [Ardenticatena sp.]
MWKKRVKQILLYLILATPVIWLAGGIILYFQGTVSTANWRSIFLLQNSPFWSVLLLVLVGVIYWMSANRHWLKVFKWFERFKTLNRITQTTILLSTIFYISLLVTTLLFPRLTGYTFQSDWSLLLVATVPLLALVILLLIERATSVKAKFAGIEIEFQRTITIPISQTVTLERDLIAKGYTYEIRRIVEEIQARRESPHILIVRIGRRRGQMRVEFLALRDYVYELSRIAPIEYIVFIDEDDRYLGFMTVEQFKAKYPKFGVEILFEDFERDKRAYRWWERFFRVPFPEVREALQRVRHELVLPLWDPQRTRQEITEHDLPRLGATQLYLQKPTVVEAYRRMVENRVPGIPVVDERGKFLGVATKDRVIQEVILQLLEK